MVFQVMCIASDAKRSLLKGQQPGFWLCQMGTADVLHHRRYHSLSLSIIERKGWKSLRKQQQQLLEETETLK